MGGLPLLTSKSPDTLQPHLSSFPTLSLGETSGYAWDMAPLCACARDTPASQFFSFLLSHHRSQCSSTQASDRHYQFATGSD